MKRIGTIIAILMVMIMTAAPCFAESLRIESTTPEDGAKDTTKENLCVKIIFNNEVGNEESQEANKDAFRIVDNTGKEIPSVIYYNKEDEKYVLVHVDSSKVPTTGDDAIQDNTEYTCIIDADFRDNEGNTLGEEQRVSFTTMNQGRGIMVYMILMIGMMVVMMGLTVYQTKKDAEKKAAQDVPEETFNPYKEAKQTGKSVEQVIAEHEKASSKEGDIMGLLGVSKEKAEEEPKRRDKNAKRDGEYYCVKKPQPISAAGSTYKTGRKAKAEAEAAKAEAEKQARKAEGYSKKKSDKKEDTNNNKKKKKGGRK